MCYGIWKWIAVDRVVQAAFVVAQLGYLTRRRWLGGRYHQAREGEQAPSFYRLARLCGRVGRCPEYVHGDDMPAIRRSNCPSKPSGDGVMFLLNETTNQTEFESLRCIVPLGAQSVQVRMGCPRRHPHAQPAQGIEQCGQRLAHVASRLPRRI